MDGKRRFVDVLARYSLILAFAVPDFFVFYLVFEPLTVYPVYWILGIFTDASMSGSVIVADGVHVKLVRACIAGSAYYFLFLLNFSTPGMKVGRRIGILFLSFLMLLAFNVARILLLAWLHFGGFSVFDSVHWFLWHFMSTALVIGIWFFQVRRFGMGEIPVYSDVGFLIGKMRKKSTIRSRRRKLQACIFP